MPVATIEDPESAPALAAALRAGGIGCLEVAFRHPRAAEALRAARGVEGVLVGAGTILSPAQAEQARAAGAEFAVAPGTNAAVLEACRALGLPFFPGVATPTEIERALGLGLETLKVFPAAQLGGPAFLRAVAEVYPGVGFLPTGGITAENVADYLAVPAVVACAGSWLVPRALLRERRFGEITALAAACAATCRPR